MSGTPSKGRAVILTAIEVEFLAVRQHLADPHEETYHGTVYERGNFASEKWVWDVLIGQIGAGNAASAAAVERAIRYVEPMVILFVGVAGGIKEKDVKIGDVVAATKAYGYESGKVEETGFFVRPEVGLSSHRMVERAKAEARKRTWLQRRAGYPYVQASELQAFVGPIAAGEKVMASTNADLFAFLHKHYNDTLAIEMEGRGFLEAAHANEHVQALIVRSISDLIDNKSIYDAQGSQKLAASHAAAFAFEVLAQLDVPVASQRQDVSNRNVTSPRTFSLSKQLGEPTAPPLLAPSETMNKPNPLEIYYSFAPVKEDEALVGQFAKQLAVLRDQKRITEWYRRKVIPGQVVHTEVTKHLNTASIFLLFISPDYMARDECMYEMRRAVERQTSGTATVIPILLRPVALLEETPFAHIQGFPRNGRPISELGNRKGSVFTEIANEISVLVKDFK